MVQARISFLQRFVPPEVLWYDPAAAGGSGIQSFTAAAPGFPRCADTEER